MLLLATMLLGMWILISALGDNGADDDDDGGGPDKGIMQPVYQGSN